MKLERVIPRNLGLIMIPTGYDGRETLKTRNLVSTYHVIPAGYKSVMVKTVIP